VPERGREASTKRKPWLNRGCGAIKELNSYSPICVIPPVLYTRHHPQTACVRRTSRRNLVIRRHYFGRRGAMDCTVLPNCMIQRLQRYEAALVRTGVHGHYDTESQDHTNVVFPKLSCSRTASGLKNDKGSSHPR
jgi:hypothetical protein